SVMPLRVLVLRGELDSLQRIFFRRQLTPDAQRMLKDQFTEVVTQLMGLQHQMDRMTVRMRRDMADAFQDPELEAAMAGGLQDAERASLDAKRFGAVRPKGWIGITPVGPAIMRVNEDGLWVRYLNHPSIESVDPESPADRA